MAHTKVTKTYSQNTGVANTFSYSGSFDVFKATEVVALLDNVALTYTASTINDSASPREYSVDTIAKTIHIGGANLSSGTIIMRPNTDLGSPTPRAEFTPGASIAAADLNNNQLQLLRRAMEYEETVLFNTGDTMTGDLTMGEDTVIIFEGATDDDYETTLTVVDPTADRTITLPNVTGTVVTTGDTGTVTATMLAANSVDSSELVDGSIDESHISSNAVTTAKIANDNVTTDKLAAGAVTTAKIGGGAVTTNALAAGAVTTAKIGGEAVTTAAIADNAVTSAKLADDAITGAKLADNSVDSEHYVDGSIDTVHIAAAAITSSKIGGGEVTTDALANNAVQTAKIADDAVDANKLAYNSVDHTHIAPDSVRTAEIADAVIISDHLATNSIIEAKITDGAVSEDKIAGNAVTIGKIGCEQTTISDSDSHIPTSGAVVDYVASMLNPIGGLEVIADDESFPNTIPAAGVVISITDAAGLQVNSSGVSTNGDALDNSTITINGFPSELRGGVGSNPDPYVFQSGAGLMVVSTGSSQTYNYHQAMIRESDFVQLSDDINDFNNRYRIHDGEPGTNNDDGDMVWDTQANKMKVYDATASAWTEVTSTGDFKFLVPVDAGTTTAATWDGNDTSFDLKETTNTGSAASVSNVNQLIVSLNGVIQKPNTGSYSASEEGFYLTDSDTIRFCTAPPTGSSAFILQCGSAVSIPTPGDGTVTEAKIANGAVTQAKIAKPLDFDDGEQARFGTGNDLSVRHSGSNAEIVNTDGDLNIRSNALYLKNEDDDETYVKCANDAQVELYYNNSKKFETTNNGWKSDDSVKGVFGTDGDLEIFHDNSDAYISNTSNTDLIIRNLGNAGIDIKPQNSYPVSLYYNGAKEFQTVANGIELVSDTSASGTTQTIYLSPTTTTNRTRSCSIAAENTDGNNNNALIFKTCAADTPAERLRITQSGTVRIPDEGKFTAGDQDDLKIYHNGSNAFINNNVGDFNIQGDALYLKNKDNDETYIKCANDAQVELFHNNISMLRTHAAGIAVGEVGETQRIFFSDSNNEDEGMISYTHSSDELALVAWGAERLIVKSNDKVQTNLDFKPGTDDSLDIGASGARFDDVYATNGSIQTSDRNEKENITATDLGLEFINKLTPVSFKRKGKTRTHYGLVAQDIETVITDLGKNTTQFAPLIKEDISEKQDGSDIRYGLRYDELISPLVKAIQELSAEIETLKTKVAALEAK